MSYISKKIEKKIFYSFLKCNNKNNVHFSFLNFALFSSKKNRFFIKYLLEVGLLKKINK